MPLWWGQINKRVFNPRALRDPKWQVINHVGRTSGRAYRTPIDAPRTDDGFIVALVYGSGADWVQNVLAAGAAAMESEGERFELRNPTIHTRAEALEHWPADAKMPPGLLKINEYLTLTIA